MVAYIVLELTNELTEGRRDLFQVLDSVFSVVAKLRECVKLSGAVEEFQELAVLILVGEEAIKNRNAALRKTFNETCSHIAHKDSPVGCPQSRGLRVSSFQKCQL